MPLEFSMTAFFCASIDVAAHSSATTAANSVRDKDLFSGVICASWVASLVRAQRVV